MKWNDINLEVKEVKQANGTENTLGWFQTN